MLGSKVDLRAGLEGCEAELVGAEGLVAGFAAGMEEGWSGRGGGADIVGGEVTDGESAWLDCESPDFEAEFGGQLGEKGE